MTHKNSSAAAKEVEGPHLTVLPNTNQQHATLKRAVTWKSAFVVSLGGSILVAISLGPMAAELGSASVFVWSLTALVGVIQCFMIAELALMYPDKAGGTPVYANEGFKHVSKIPGAVSNWGYYLGWIPVVPVNLLLAAGYLKAAFFPDTNVMILTAALALPIFVCNYFGLVTGVWTAVVMAVCALVPLTAICFAPILKPELFHVQNILPFSPLNGSWTSGASWLLMIKWAFVASWASYAFEAASTVIAELKNPQKDTTKAMAASSLVGVFAYCVLPLMVLALVGTETLSKDASVSFLAAAQLVFGQVGGNAIVLMLVAALLLGAQTAIIGSSRTVYQMSKDGMMPKQFSFVNRYGTPSGCMAWDLCVTGALLAIFGDQLLSLVAAANVGYLVTFLVLIPAYLMLRNKRHPDVKLPFKLPKAMNPVIVAILVFNWILILVGGPQWGSTVMVTGSAIMLTFVPFYLYRTQVQDKQNQ